MTTSSSDADWHDPAVVAGWWKQPFEQRVETVNAIFNLPGEPLPESTGPKVERTPITTYPDALDASLERIEELEEFFEYLDALDADPINHPTHYAAGWSNGAEVIDITENLNFNRGNAVKYLARAGRKNPEREVEDLRKAAWYLQREIDRLVWA